MENESSRLVLNAEEPNLEKQIRNLKNENAVLKQLLLTKQDDPYPIIGHLSGQGRERMNMYEVACFNCGIRAEIEMYAHRNNDGFICGWLFICTKCSDTIKERHLVLMPEGFKPVHVF